MWRSRSSSLRSQRDQREPSAFSGSLGSVMTSPSATKTFSSAACRRPVRLSNRGKWSTRNRYSSYSSIFARWRRRERTSSRSSAWNS